MAGEDGEKREMELQLERAVSSRLQHFKDQADSLTLESVRRLLEKDLGLEKFALDAHKRFIRQYLEKKMDDAENCNSKPAVENVDKDVHLDKDEATTSPNRHEAKNNSKKTHTADEEMTEDSPIMGVLSPKSEVGSQGSPVSESMIEKAISKRADHFLANTDLTLAGVRHLLEEDLGLEKGALDPFRKFIGQRIDQVLNSPKEGESAKDVKKKSVKNLKKKRSEETSDVDGSDSMGGESEDLEDKIKSKKEAASRRKIKKVQQPKKRKISEDVEISGEKQKKNAKRKKKEDNDSDGDGSLSEEGQSQSPVEKPTQMKEKTAYGKQVENLKAIIKACGMSVAPSIYKKAKQVPENKREGFIVKELEAILSREGLSKNPSEKEIKDCRKRKDTARELEGIDTSNIISSSRRRSTFSFVAPSKPEIHPKKGKVDAKKDKSKDNNDKDQNGDHEEEDEKKDEEEDEKKDEEEDEKKDEEEEVEEEDEEVEEEEEGDDDEDEEEEEDDESEEFNEDDNEESD